MNNPPVPKNLHNSNTNPIKQTSNPSTATTVTNNNIINNSLSNILNSSSIQGGEKVTSLYTANFHAQPNSAGESEKKDLIIEDAFNATPLSVGPAISSELKRKSSDDAMPMFYHDINIKRQKTERHSPTLPAYVQRRNAHSGDERPTRESHRQGENANEPFSTLPYALNSNASEAAAKAPIPTNPDELREEVIRLRQRVVQLEEQNAGFCLQTAALDAADEGVLITDSYLPDHPIIYSNFGFTRMTGYFLPDIVGKNCRFLQGKDTDRAAVTRMREAIMKKEKISLELLNYKKNGEPFWNRIFISPISAPPCPGRYFMAIELDVTEEKTKLLDFELRERALDAASESILVTDLRLPDNPIVYANKGFEKMTGYTVNDVLGKNCRFLQGSGTEREVVTKVREAIKRREPLAVEILNYKKDGTPFWNQFSLTPVKDSLTGEITHYVAVQYEHPLLSNNRDFFRVPL